MLGAAGVGLWCRSAQAGSCFSGRRGWDHRSQAHAARRPRVSEAGPGQKWCGVRGTVVRWVCSCFRVVAESERRQVQISSAGPGRRRPRGSSPGQLPRAKRRREANRVTFDWPNGPRRVARGWKAPGALKAPDFHESGAEGVLAGRQAPTFGLGLPVGDAGVRGATPCPGSTVNNIRAAATEDVLKRGPRREPLRISSVAQSEPIVTRSPGARL